PECGKMFRLKAGLLKHRLIHTEKSRATSYIRRDCGRSFARHTDLTRHRRAHRGERPHRCTGCGKTSLEKTRLTDHLRTH
ncbi:ZN777 protein, partial [Pedionomus torquatus]|nr:ZN777 protein [Pedionomus torquatus]